MPHLIEVDGESGISSFYVNPEGIFAYRCCQVGEGKIIFLPLKAFQIRLAPFPLIVGPVDGFDHMGTGIDFQGNLVVRGEGEAVLLVLESAEIAGIDPFRIYKGDRLFVTAA